MNDETGMAAAYSAVLSLSFRRWVIAGVSLIRVCAVTPPFGIRRKVSQFIQRVFGRGAWMCDEGGLSPAMEVDVLCERTPSILFCALGDFASSSFFFRSFILLSSFFHSFMGRSALNLLCTLNFTSFLFYLPISSDSKPVLTIMGNL